MKKCFKCGVEKSIGSFYVHKQMKDGHLNKCIDCAKNDTRNNPKVNSNIDGGYDRTEKGVIRVMYKTQVANSKKRNHPMPSYSKEELKEWLYNSGFKKLYDHWKYAKYDKNIKPSVDRIDDFKPYTIQNIVLGTWQDNKNHQYSDIMKGIGTGGKRCKAVQCININGIVVAEYISRSAAIRAVGYCIDKSLYNGTRDRKNKYQWKYKGQA